MQIDLTAAIGDATGWGMSVAGLWRLMVLIGGVVAVAIGVALNENGIEHGRTLFIAGLPFLLGGVILLVLPRRRAARAEPSAVEAFDPVADVAAYWGMEYAAGHAKGIVKGRSVEVAMADELIRVRALASRALDMGLTVLRGGRPPGDARKEYTTGDPVFDAEYCVRVDEPPRAENLLTQRLREQLLTAHASLDDKGVELVVARCDPDALANLVRLGCKVAGELDRASPKVRCAEQLIAIRDAWQAYAEREKLATADTPLSMWGDKDGFKVQALAVRDAFQHFHFELRVDFPQPLGRGLALKPASATTQFDRSGEPIGHPAFDKVFLIKASDPTDAARLVGPETRAALLELRDAGLQLRASDEGLWAWVGFNPSHSNQVPDGLGRMVNIAKRIVSNAERFAR